MDNPKTGSGSLKEPVFALIGSLQRVHGVHGEIEMRVLTNFPQRIHRGKKVYLGEDHQPIILTGVRPKAELLLLSFEGIETPEQAKQLTNLEVYVETRSLPVLPEGHYYQHQILGLYVYEEEELLGEISEIIETGANDVFVIHQANGKDLLIPNIPAVVLSIDLNEKRMIVHLIEGLRG